MHKFVQQVIASVQGTDWPADAVCSLRVQYSSWPVGSRDSVGYYRSWMELRRAVRRWRRFAQLEDNYIFELSVWKWDLGPTYVGDL